MTKALRTTKVELSPFERHTEIVSKCDENLSKEYIELAIALHAARKEVGEDFERFCEQFDFGASNGAKLASIVDHEIFTKHRGKIESIAWTAVYAAIQLSPRDYERFETEVLYDDNAPRITRSVVEKYKRHSSKATFRSLMSVTIDPYADLNDNDENDLINMANQLEKRFEKKIKVKRNPLNFPHAVIPKNEPDRKAS